MSELEDKINQILSDPEALKQVQSLGEQLGLSQSPPEPPKLPPSSVPVSDDMLGTITRLAPLMQSFKSDDDTTRLLNALKPFLSEDKRQKLDRAEKLIKLIETPEEITDFSDVMIETKLVEGRTIKQMLWK